MHIVVQLEHVHNFMAHLLDLFVDHISCSWHESTNSEDGIELFVVAADLSLLLLTEMRCNKHGQDAIGRFFNPLDACEVDVCALQVLHLGLAIVDFLVDGKDVRPGANLVFSQP